MANTENREEYAFPAKRKTGDGEGEGGDRSGKSLKLGPLEELNHAGVNDDNRSESGDGNARREGNHSEKAPVLEEKREDEDADAGAEVEEEEEEEDGDYEDDDDEDDDDGGEEEEDEDDEGDEVDVKGKRILKDDKGKGKLIVEEEEDNGDSSSDDYGNVGVPSESDSDLSDDPLAEVDLDNILPSRTRQRTARPGVFISGDGKDGGDDRS